MVGRAKKRDKKKRKTILDDRAAMLSDELVGKTHTYVVLLDWLVGVTNFTYLCVSILGKYRIGR